MRVRGRRYLATFVVGALLLAACGDDPEVVPDPADEEEQAADEPDDGTDEPAETETDETDETDEADDRDPFRIGVLMPQTGPVGASGEQFIEAFELYWEVNGATAGGRSIEWAIGDDQGDPSTAVSEAQRLLDSENVEVIAGPILGNTALAVGDFLAERDVPQIYGFPQNEVWLRDGPPETLFPFMTSFSQTGLPLGRWAAENGYERVATFCSDYVTGWEVCGGFVNAFTSYGGEVVQQQWAPIDAPDYAPVVSSIQSIADDIDAVYLGAPVGAGVAFFRTWAEFGMTEELPILSHQVVIDPSALESYGPESVGLISTSAWTESTDLPETREFAEAFEEASGRIPTSNDASGWFTAFLIQSALDELGGDMPGTQEFLDILEDLELDTIYGPWSTDEHGNVIANTYLREVVERDDGQLWSENFLVIEGTGPTYTFDVDAYLAQPQYSPDYQGIGWPEDCSGFATDCPLD